MARKGEHSRCGNLRREYWYNITEFKPVTIPRRWMLINTAFVDEGNPSDVDSNCGRVDAKNSGAFYVQETIYHYKDGNKVNE